MYALKLRKRGFKTSEPTSLTKTPPWVKSTKKLLKLLWRNLSIAITFVRFVMLRQSLLFVLVKWTVTSATTGLIRGHRYQILDIFESVHFAAN